MHRFVLFTILLPFIGVSGASGKTTPTEPPVCATCQEGVLSLKNAIPKMADFARTTIGTIIDKVCAHILPEFDFLAAFCHVIDKDVENKVFKFLMALHDAIDEKKICHNLSFCPQ